MVMTGHKLTPFSLSLLLIYWPTLSSILQCIPYASSGVVPLSHTFNNTQHNSYQTLTFYNDSDLANQQQPHNRRITSKSIFIAPAFNKCPTEHVFHTDTDSCVPFTEVVQVQKQQINLLERIRQSMTLNGSISKYATTVAQPLVQNPPVSTTTTTTTTTTTSPTTIVTSSTTNTFIPTIATEEITTAIAAMSTTTTDTTTEITTSGPMQILIPFNDVNIIEDDEIHPIPSLIDIIDNNNNNNNSFTNTSKEYPFVSSSNLETTTETSTLFNDYISDTTTTVVTKSGGGDLPAYTLSESLTYSTPETFDLLSDTKGSSSLLQADDSNVGFGFQTAETNTPITVEITTDSPMTVESDTLPVTVPPEELSSSTTKDGGTPNSVVRRYHVYGSQTDYDSSRKPIYVTKYVTDESNTKSSTTTPPPAPVPPSPAGVTYSFGQRFPTASQFLSFGSSSTRSESKRQTTPSPTSQTIMYFYPQPQQQSQPPSPPPSELPIRFPSASSPMAKNSDRDGSPVRFSETTRDDINDNDGSIGAVTGISDSNNKNSNHFNKLLPITNVMSNSNWNYLPGTTALVMDSSSSSTSSAADKLSYHPFFVNQHPSVLSSTIRFPGGGGVSQSAAKLNSAASPISSLMVRFPPGQKQDDPIFSFESSPSSIIFPSDGTTGFQSRYWDGDNSARNVNRHPLAYWDQWTGSPSSKSRLVRIRPATSMTNYQASLPNVATGVEYNYQRYRRSQMNSFRRR